MVFHDKVGIWLDTLNRGNELEKRRCMGNEGFRSLLYELSLRYFLMFRLVFVDLVITEQMCVI